MLQSKQNSGVVTEAGGGKGGVIGLPSNFGLSKKMSENLRLFVPKNGANSGVKWKS